MEFNHTDHTQKYFSTTKKLMNQLVQFEWTSVNSFNIDLNKDDDGLKYQFLKFSSKLFTKIQETKNNQIDNFLNDSNILSLGIISVRARSKVQLHKDHDYWSAPFHRIHIPLNSPGAYFIYGDNKIIWEVGKIYIFDVMGVSHGAVNDTDVDFKMVYVDISQQPVSSKSKTPLDDLFKQYQQKVLETTPHDLIFDEHKKYCTQDELQAEKQYLDHYKRNLEIG